MTSGKFVSMAVDGDLVIFVNQVSGGESNIYLLDRNNLRWIDLCDKIDAFCPYRTSSVAMIDGYLYFGGSSYYTTGEIPISRIKYSITPQVRTQKPLIL